MATSPEQIRKALRRIARAAREELAAVARAASQEPDGLRAALFAAAPLIVGEYTPAASTLALDWYEELREDVAPQRLFRPTPRLSVNDDDVAAIVARSTEMLREVQEDVEQLMAAAEANLAAEVERQIAEEFRATITENVADDPDAVGWRRFARPEACKFCLMLAARGAVYTASTARFAAHGPFGRDGKRKGGACMCIAGPAFGGKEIWAEATPMQYVASRRKRSDADRARLRDYLNHNFPAAPG